MTSTTRPPPRGQRLPRIARAAPSCSTRPRPSSSSPATTRPRWTTSPSGPGSPSRCSTSTSPASSTSTSRCSTSTATTLEQLVRDGAGAPTATTRSASSATIARLLRVRRAARARPSGWSSSPTSPTSPQVRRALDAVEPELRRGDRRGHRRGHRPARRRARACSASALAGMAQVAARHWLAQGGDVPEDEAAASSAPSPGAAWGRSPSSSLTRDRVGVRSWRMPACRPPSAG